MNIGNIIENVVDAITGRDEQRRPQDDILPASQDPLGDPADESQDQAGYAPGDVLPASQDPYGDPADEMADVLPASQDPLGDPADEDPARAGRGWT